MAFLISSPLVSEIAAVLCRRGAGWLAAGIYVLSGCLISVLGGYLCDRLRLVRWIQPDSFPSGKKNHLRAAAAACGKEAKKPEYPG